MEKKRGCDSRKRAEDRRDRDGARGIGARGGCWPGRGIGFSVRGVTHPAFNRPWLRPFERWPPADRPIRFRDVARAEKARANAPFA